MFISTYGKDFLHPADRRHYNFYKLKYGFTRLNEDIPVVTPPESEAVKHVTKTLAADDIAEDDKPLNKNMNDDSIWSSIGPMGRFIPPANVPEVEYRAEQRKEEEKFKKCMLDVDEKLKKSRIVNKEKNAKLLTSYQIHYEHAIEEDDCNIPNKVEEEEDYLDAHTRDIIMKNLNKKFNLLESNYKPFGLVFVDSSAFPAHTARTQWHMPEFSKEPILSEYMSTISRTGCIVVKNKLHEHKYQVCKEKGCIHFILHNCKKFK